MTVGCGCWDCRGRFVASLIMLLGIVTIAIPVTIIGTKFSDVWIEARTVRTQHIHPRRMFEVWVCSEMISEAFVRTGGRRARGAEG